MPVFGLTTDQAQRLIDQHRDLLGLCARGLFVDLDLHVGRDLHAHFGHHPIDLDPPLSNPVIRLAARRQTQFGHALVQPQRAARAIGGGVGLPSGNGRLGSGWCSATKDRGFGCICHMLFIM